MRRFSARVRSDRGQALVEFAVVLPVLILIILGITYFGRYMQYSNQMTQLAEEGARWASVDYQSAGTLQNYIRLQAQGELLNSSSDVTGALAVYIYYPTSNPTPNNTVGNSLRVCVVATVRYPFLGAGGLTSTIGQNATMRIEKVADATSFVPDAIGTLPSQCPTT